ncbi:MAG TPA: hypothetical protein VGL94_03595 [Ktedonobacteraceae bacterium]|jgi:hypothetical protein
MQSEIARFREQQELQEQAAKNALYSFANVASHDAIEKRLEIGATKIVQLMQQGRVNEAMQIMQSPTWS